VGNFAIACLSKQGYKWFRQVNVVDETKQPNWVDRRALCERVLESKSGEVWEGLRAAIQDACQSYSDNYPPNVAAHVVSCKLENGRRIHVGRTTYDEQTGTNSKFTALVEFDPKTFSIAVTRDSGTAQGFRVSGDENRAFLMQGDKHMTADEVSRVILEPILFPKITPRQIPVRRPGGGGSAWA
jgi:hypothetical protein